MEDCISVCSSIDAEELQANAVVAVVVTVTTRYEPKLLSALTTSPALTDKRM